MVSGASEGGSSPAEGHVAADGAAGTVQTFGSEKSKKLRGGAESWSEAGERPRSTGRSRRGSEGELEETRKRNRPNRKRRSGI